MKTLKERLASIVIAIVMIGRHYVRDLEVEGALALILKYAIKPNLVQTIYGTPAFVHGGPFCQYQPMANLFWRQQQLLAFWRDYTVILAGFGAD